MTTTRRLAAILAADVAGYSAAMERDEEGTAAAVRALRRNVIELKLAEHHGRLIKTTGDGFLAEFASPIAALNCALAIQQRPEGGLQLRIGLNLGDVIIEESGDLLGEGVNIAARLEGLAEPGGILVSDKIVREVEGKVEALFEDRGEQQVKNISKPVRAYAVRTGAQASASLLAPGAPLPLPDKPSIAVLPFQNMSGDPEQEYFADGVVEEIITALSKFRSLFVIARNSSFTYKGKAVDIKQVGRELGVRYVLEGSVRKAGERIRITGQLIEASTGVHLWADKFEAVIADLFDLQDRLTSEVVGIVAPTIEQAEIKRAINKPTSNLEAYDWYLRGIANFYQYSSSANELAVQMFRRALALDPDFSGAAAGICACYAVRALQSWMSDPIGEAADALRCARRCQEIGQDDAFALTAAAFCHVLFASNFETASALAARAIYLNPNEARGWHISGWINILKGNPELGIEHSLKALQLNPIDKLNTGVMVNMALAYILLDQFLEAQSWVRKAVAEKPNHLPALRVSAMVDAALGQSERARQTIDRILERSPKESILTTSLTRVALRPEDKAKYANYLRLAGMPE